MKRWPGFLMKGVLAALGLLANGCGKDSSFQALVSDAGVTADGAAPVCSSNAECSATETCNVATGKCEALQSTCMTNGDCAARPDGKKVCDAAARLCVTCITPADCGTGKRCENATCVETPTCKNSLDCPPTQVCDAATGLCVACLANADCLAGERCVSQICRGLCTSDKDCTPLGQLCDRAAGNCVTCLGPGDCAVGQHCIKGACATDLCAPGTSRCEGNAVVGCNAEGSGLLAPVPCKADQGCAVQGTTAACRNAICPPMVTGCLAGTEKAVICSADGLMQTLVEDCGANNQVCIAAACKPTVCQAGSLFCSAGEVRRCSTKGDTSVTALTCTSMQYCSDVDHACKAKICTPNMPACNNGVATTCNSVGSGYVAGGTNCANLGQLCMQGACTALVCAPSQPACNNTVATTCNASGTGYVAGGTDCAGQACVQGVCKPIVCTPNASFCSAETIRQCSPDGTSSALSQTCLTSEYCDAGGLTCKPQVCTPGQPACDVNVATSCNANGSAFIGARTDCALTNQSCSSGQCTGCIRVLGSQWVRTRYPTSTPWSLTMTDGAAQVPTTGYGWVGWFEYDVNFPSSGNFHMLVRLADDGWHEGKAGALFNQIAVLVDGTKHLDFNANTTAYDDGQIASGDLRFHNVTGTTFSASAGSHVLHFDNIADQWVGGDDLTLYFQYIDICAAP